MRERLPHVHSLAAVGAMILAAAVALSHPRTLGAASRAAPAQGHSPADRLFEFDSNPWNNLHHFLYVLARARRGLDHDRPAVTASLADTVGVAKLSAAQRASWDHAVGFFMQNLAERDVLFDTAMVSITNRLSDLAPTSSIREAKLDSALSATLSEAMPIYRQVWWPRHDSLNRAWIARVRPLLDARGDSAARWIARVMRTPWAPAPVRVEVAPYTNWAGAYTTENPARINVSSVDADGGAMAPFETLFHEVQHTMSDTLFSAFQSASRAAGKRMHRDPTHVFIFYTAGEISRQLFPGYVPFADATGFWKRTGDMDGMRPLVAKWWQPWIDGRGTLEDAVRGIASEMK